MKGKVRKEGDGAADCNREWRPHSTSSGFQLNLARRDGHGKVLILGGPWPSLSVPSGDPAERKQGRWRGWRPPHVSLEAPGASRLAGTVSKQAARGL